ncbi:MAG: PD-(D/E)XK nuclease family protein [Pirellulaceae bacterium]|nr:PD-(D/E)XK nuclease family protein [Pirellulaceae bacterium]
MHARTIARAEPYVWVSWITKLLAGESSCLWSAWLRAHYQTAKPPNGFDLNSWQMDHSAMLRTTAAEHEKQGYKIYTEDQNLFTLKGKSGTLSGKPDVVAIKGNSGLIVDTKTGFPKASDRIQVLIYMWAMPKTNPAFAGVMFDGMVAYRTGHCYILADEVDVVFVKRVAELMKTICGDEEPHKAPSFGECKFCPLTPEDCEDRVGAKMIYEGETNEF